MLREDWYTIHFCAWSSSEKEERSLGRREYPLLLLKIISEPLSGQLLCPELELQIFPALLAIAGLQCSPQRPPRPTELVLPFHRGEEHRAVELIIVPLSGDPGCHRVVRLLRQDDALPGAISL